MKARITVVLFLAAQAFAGAALADALDRIKSANTINVAYSPDSLPFSFDKDGQPTGYSIDICKRVISQVGHAVGQSNLKVNWIAGSTLRSTPCHGSRPIRS